VYLVLKKVGKFNKMYYTAFERAVSGDMMEIVLRTLKTKNKCTSFSLVAH
jgi:hypothetical protein